MHLTPQFIDSYDQLAEYPYNLRNDVTYRSLLLSHKERLDAHAPGLFEQDAAAIKIPFRDLTDTRQGSEYPPRLAVGRASVDSWAEFRRQNVLSDDELREWLGDTKSLDPLTSRVTGDIATKKDPHCRFIFLGLDRERGPLKITRRMLCRILTYHQVAPDYLNFLYIFGRRDGRARDVRYSAFRSHASLTVARPGMAIPDLGRTGFCFELCYNLKTVVCKNPSADTTQRSWTIRQGGVYHQFDVGNGKALWLMTTAEGGFKQKVEQLTGPGGRREDRSFDTPADCFISSLSVRTLLVDWAAEEWRWYTQWLEDMVEDQTVPAMIVFHQLPSEDLIKNMHKQMQRGPGYFKEKVGEAVTVMEANISVLTKLRTYYESLAQKQICLTYSVADPVDDFARRVNEAIHELNMQCSRAKLLAQITGDRKDQILQQLQVRATEKMEHLTFNMQDVGIQAQREAVAMRINTIVTLVYLPATFVSTFFSTDVVKYQTGDPNQAGTFSALALYRWLQVTLPLTCIALGLSFFWFRRAQKVMPAAVPV